MNGITILQGDALEVLRTLPDESVHCVVTSPPYWGLRDYGCEGQIGLEPTPGGYAERMVGVFAEARRVLRADGTLWLNMGDCYATGAGLVGECPGGGEQGERWKGHRGVRVSGKQEYLSKAMGHQRNRGVGIGISSRKRRQVHRESRAQGRSFGIPEKGCVVSTARD